MVYLCLWLRPDRSCLSTQMMMTVLPMHLLLLNQRRMCHSVPFLGVRENLEQRQQEKGMKRNPNTFATRGAGTASFLMARCLVLLGGRLQRSNLCGGDRLGCVRAGLCELLRAAQGGGGRVSALDAVKERIGTNRSTRRAYSSIFMRRMRSTLIFSKERRSPSRRAMRA